MREDRGKQVSYYLVLFFLLLGLALGALVNSAEKLISKFFKIF